LNDLENKVHALLYKHAIGLLMLNATRHERT